ncbi:MAG: bifunctional DNA primase/polymerase [Ilumatobacteraceae bacterium]
MACRPDRPRHEMATHHRLANRSHHRPGHDPGWWRSDDGASIVTGAAPRLVVVDVDPRHDGDDTLNDLETEHGPLPDTVESVTGGGGRHIYLRMPDGSTYPRNDQTGITLGAGVDIRGDGGQVVAPPTIHPDTHVEYVWEVEHSPFDGVAVAAAPDWLVELLTAQPEQARAPPGRSHPSAVTVPATTSTPPPTGLICSPAPAGPCTPRPATAAATNCGPVLVKTPARAPQRRCTTRALMCSRCSPPRPRRSRLAAPMTGGGSTSRSPKGRSMPARSLLRALPTGR